MTELARAHREARRRVVHGGDVGRPGVRRDLAGSDVDGDRIGCRRVEECGGAGRRRDGGRAGEKGEERERRDARL
ncbi:MAG: hypothetical protein EPO40_02605 [Myxococcaceae bacterium]|nr:MAG: hypothetical protein EPO40_02605 [Myxococcaceae bacterium]